MSQQQSVIDTNKVVLTKEEKKLFENDVLNGLVTVDHDGTVKLHGFGEHHDITL